MTAALTPPPKAQFFAANGTPLVGGKLYSYAAGTTTPLATYTSSEGISANTNPVILNSRGEADVWLDNVMYKLALYDAADVLIWTVDNVSSVNSGIFNGPVSGTTATFSRQLTAAGGAFSGEVSGATGVFSGNLAAGSITTPNGSGILALNASNLSSGTVPDARFPAVLPAVSGVNLTNLLTSSLIGAIPAAQIAGAVNASGSAPFYVARAWVTFDGTGSGPGSPLGSGNVASVTDNGVGDYTITFTTALPAATYAVLGSGATLGLSAFVVRCNSGGGPVTLKTTSEVRVYLSNQSSAVDNTYVSVVII
jgi:hypothetical protein